eukprot:2849081-Rhodomonas_salina.1
MHIKKYLTEQAVLEIFAARPRPGPDSARKPTKHQLSINLANLYGVSNKTIQQIWNRKCWAKLTEPFFEDWERTTDATSSRPADEPSRSVQSISTTDSGVVRHGPDTATERLGGAGGTHRQDQHSTSSPCITIRSDGQSSTLAMRVRTSDWVIGNKAWESYTGVEERDGRMQGEEGPWRGGKGRSMSAAREVTVRCRDGEQDEGHWETSGVSLAPSGATQSPFRSHVTNAQSGISRSPSDTQPPTSNLEVDGAGPGGGNGVNEYCDTTTTGLEDQPSSSNAGMSIASDPHISGPPRGQPPNSDPDVATHIPDNGGLESDTGSLLDAIERLPEACAENPFTVDWDS